MTTFTKRREARELAFQLVFEKSFSEDSMSDIIKTAELSRDITPDEYAVKVATGVYEHLDTIDEAITRHSVSRNLARLSRVVHAILRLALYEIIYLDDIDISISINEAVELAKRFAGEDEAGFINGVLGGYVRADNGKTSNSPNTEDVTARAADCTPLEDATVGETDVTVQE